MKTINIKKEIDCSKHIIVFYFPWKIVSGGPIYLANLAIRLSNNNENEVFYIEYKGGYARNFLNGTKVNIIDYSDQQSFNLLPDNEITLITPIYWGHRVPRLNDKSKILFFNWHNLCIPSLQANLQCNDELLKEFLLMLKNNDAVFFCDKAHWEAQERYGVHFKEKYVPITISERGKLSNGELIDEKKINIAVIGRLVVDKIYAVTDLLDNLRLIENRIINLYVIGDGDCRNILETYPRSANITITFLGMLDIPEIGNVLREKVDVLFAMGTSALEGASLAIPTLIIPNDTVPFKCDKYAYIFDCHDFLLGWGPEQIDSIDIKTYSAKRVIDQIYNDNNKCNLGKKCREYYVKNHKDNTSYLLSAIDECTLLYEEYYENAKRIKKQSIVWIENNILKIIENHNNRNVVIWGAGKGGKKLYKLLKKMGVDVSFFVDKKAVEIVEIDKKAVLLPDKLKVGESIILISLLTYINEIPKELEKNGFKKNDDYLYVFFPNF